MTINADVYQIMAWVLPGLDSGRRGGRVSERPAYRRAHFGNCGWMPAITFLALASLVPAQTSTVKAPISGGALDIGADLAGTPDPRALEWPGKVWGNAGYSDTAIQFAPPPGYQVHIISAVGTVSSFAHGTVPTGTTTGLSWGLVSNAVTAAPNAAVNPACMAYVKQSITSRHDADTTPFSFTRIGDNGILGPDNILVSRTAVYLNETGLSMHIEQALVLTYEFVPVVKASTAAGAQATTGR
jgi:hypothetical protein